MYRMYLKKLQIRQRGYYRLSSTCKAHSLKTKDYYNTIDWVPIMVIIGTY